MRSKLTLWIAAPIEEVFSFFDDPTNLLELQEQARGHLQRYEVVADHADGRRTWDFHMTSGRTSWVQTIEQTLRQEPIRQVSEGWTWTSSRDERLLTVTTDRVFRAEGNGTKLEMTTEYRIERPWRHPGAFLVNALWGNSAGRLELEHAMHFAAEHLESRQSPRYIR